MADKILTFNGKTIAGPGGTGMVMIKEPEPDPGFIDIGDTRYNTVTIGNQVWITENLEYIFNGLNVSSEESPITGEPTTPTAWLYKDGIDEVYCDNRLLYNGYAIKYLEDNKSILLPKGWHVPTLADWQTLFDTVSNISYLKSVPGKSYIYDETIDDPDFVRDFPNYNWNFESDRYGFGLMPCGNRWSGNFEDINTYAFLATSTYQNGEIIHISIDDEDRLDTYSYMKGASTIRLVKNIT